LVGGINCFILSATTNHEAYIQFLCAGRPIAEFTIKAAREIALKKLLERIGITVVCDDEADKSRRHLSIDLHASRGKAWLRAYLQLRPNETMVRPRPTGHPMYVKVVTTNPDKIVSL